MKGKAITTITWKNKQKLDITLKVMLKMCKESKPSDVLFEGVDEGHLIVGISLLNFFGPWLQL